MRSPCGSDAIWGMFLYFIVLVLTVTTVIRISKITTSFDLRRSTDRGPCHLDRMGEISRRWRSIEMTSSQHLHWTNTAISPYGMGIKRFAYKCNSKKTTGTV